MHFGVTLPQFGPFAAGPDVHERIAAVATAADRLGYHVLWTAEPLILPFEIRTPYPYGARFPFAVTDPTLEVTTTLAYVAGLTRHVGLWIAAPQPDVQALAAEVARLRRLVEARGRDPAALGVASGGRARGLEELLARLPALERAGVTIVNVPALFWARTFPHALELLPEFAAKAQLAAPRERGGEGG